MAAPFFLPLKRNVSLNVKGMGTEGRENLQAHDLQVHGRAGCDTLVQTANTSQGIAGLSRDCLAIASDSPVECPQFSHSTFTFAIIPTAPLYVEALEQANLKLKLKLLKHLKRLKRLKS